MFPFAFALIIACPPVSGNFPGDLMGAVDTRMAGQQCAGGPCIWGTTEYSMLPIKFHPPTGFRVRILSLKGDLIAWIKTMPGGPRTPEESAAGVLASFQTTASVAGSNGGSGQESSTHCDYCSDGTPLYIQDSVTDKQPKTRASFNYADLNMLLDDDNMLNAKIATFLNTTGKAIHVELTYTIQFRYEKREKEEAQQ